MERRKGRRRLLHDGTQGRGRAGKLPPRDNGNRSHRHGDVNHCRDGRGRDQRVGDGPLRVFHFFGDVDGVLKADEGEERQRRTEHDQERQARIGLFLRNFEQVHTAPIGHAGGDDDQQASRLDDRADDIGPHRFLNAAIDDGRKNENETQRRNGDEHVRIGWLPSAIDEMQDIPGEGLRLRRNGGKTGTDERQSDDETQDRHMKGALRDIGGAAGARVPGPERRIG